jgi:hypothetical protein
MRMSSHTHCQHQQHTMQPLQSAKQYLLQQLETHCNTYCLVENAPMYRSNRSSNHKHRHHHNNNQHPTHHPIIIVIQQTELLLIQTPSIPSAPTSKPPPPPSSSSVGDCDCNNQSNQYIQTAMYHHGGYNTNHMVLLRSTRWISATMHNYLCNAPLIGHTS